MKILSASQPHRLEAAFSLAEVTVGMALIATVVGALFSGFTTGFFTIKMARENLRATQIMLEKVETIRLYNWDQINEPGFVPTNFTAAYDPNSANGGITYTGSMTISQVSPALITSSYSNDMRQLTVRVDWLTGVIPRSREFTTYVTRNGLQTYVY